MKREFVFSDVLQICNRHLIEVRDIKSLSGSFEKKIFIINQEFLLRVSETVMTSEKEKFERISILNHVPKLIQAGTLHREADAIHYLLLTLLPGEDFVKIFSDISVEKQVLLGKDIALFLDQLHKIHGSCYDIGLYIPKLPNFSGTWRQGHEEYWGHLKQNSMNITLKPDSSQVLQRAFAFLQTNRVVLDYQAGARLLHNDFHPRNIIVDRGSFSGIIDWECSQFGEADFELCHLVHWCLYPPSPEIDFRPFLKGLFEVPPLCAQVPNLVQRLTIYQIEHEIQQIIWSAGQAESWRIPRLVDWIEGGVHNLFHEISGMQAGV